MATIALHQASQALETQALIELFILDLAPLEIDEKWCFTKVSHAGEPVSFGGVVFTPVEVETKGWEMNGQGAFPNPQIAVTNVYGFFNGLVINYQDAVGAKLTRIRTYQQFLDGQPQADPEAMYAPDIYNIDQKITHNKNVIEWKLAPAADQQGVTLPRRKMFRDTCGHQYRRPRENGGFDYTNVTCPYTDTRYFDKFDQPTSDPKKDQCSLFLSGCKKRFAPSGSPDAILPTWAFPGLIRNTLT